MAILDWSISNYCNLTIQFKWIKSTYCAISPLQTSAGRPTLTKQMLSMIMFWKVSQALRADVINNTATISTIPVVTRSNHSLALDANWELGLSFLKFDDFWDADTMFWSLALIILCYAMSSTWTESMVNGEQCMWI